MIRDAAPVNEDLTALWELIQADFWANQRAIVESIADKELYDPNSTSSAPRTCCGCSTTQTSGSS